MILAALVDCGVPAPWLAEQFGRLGLHGLKFGVETTLRSGMTCTHLVIDAGHAHEHRHLPDLLAIVKRGGFSAAVNDRCEKVLRRLAEAEAKIHGVSPDHVHFHEIGAVDTIVDVLGAALCLEHLGIDDLRFSDLTIGHGTIAAAHGIMPSPAPATAEMMAGFRVKHLDIEAEILTPTGCAILTALGTQSAGVPSGKVLGVGYGCGDKVFGALQYNAGRDNIADNNVFIECPQVQTGGFTLNNLLWEAARKKGTATEPLFLSRYPDLKHIFEKSGFNHLWRNVYWNCPLLIKPGYQVPLESFDVMDPVMYTTENPGFLNAAQGDFRLKPDAAVLNRIGFRPIPVEEIGLYEDEHRASWPVELQANRTSEP
jgi:hypothetical protein